MKITRPMIIFYSIYAIQSCKETLLLSLHYSQPKLIIALFTFPIRVLFWFALARSWSTSTAPQIQTGCDSCTNLKGRACYKREIKAQCFICTCLYTICASLKNDTFSKFKLHESTTKS